MAFEKLVIGRDTSFNLVNDGRYTTIKVNDIYFYHTLLGFEDNTNLDEWYWLLNIFRVLVLENNFNGLTITPSSEFFSYIEGIGNVPERETKDAVLYTTIPLENKLQDKIVVMLNRIVSILQAGQRINDENSKRRDNVSTD